MTRFLTLLHKQTLSGIIRHLPASKSISNRALLIRAMSQSNAQIENLSEANDTQLMQRLIASSEAVLDVEDAGTTMRFLTAYFAVKGLPKLLTGTARMKQRPIHLLINALRTLGADIAFTEREGFPPIKIRGPFSQKTNRIAIPGNVSSQFISALLMIGPTLSKGLTLELEGEIRSRPYIEMTISLMRTFGVTARWIHNQIEVPPGTYMAIPYTIEPDWSAASYWFAFAALARHAEITLPGLSVKSIQGDRVIIDMMELLGVKAEPRGGSLHLTSKDYRNEFSWDFSDCPDLAQTVAVVCAAKGIKATLTGLESLRLKETDRTKALQHELAKLGANFAEAHGTWQLIPAEHLPEQITPINTYMDHRMAMAFAPLCMARQVQIENPKVVRKSYPRFWQDLKSVGIIATEE